MAHIVVAHRHIGVDSRLPPHHHHNEVALLERSVVPRFSGVPATGDHG
jgi:hypothetical protein